MYISGTPKWMLLHVDIIQYNYTLKQIFILNY